VWRGLAAQLSPTSLYQAHLLDTHICTRLMVLPERTGEVEMKIFVTTNSALIGVKSRPVMARLRTTTAAIQGSPSLQPFSEDMRRKGASRAD
jgi:hypothetical protein